MQDASIDVYIAAFRARCDAVRRPGRREVDEPGVQGVLSWADDPLARQACLDASDAGRRIYLRLGFEDIAPVTRFFRAAPSARGISRV